jgi:hypothetical protein
MRASRSPVLAVAGLLLLGLTACAPGAATPTSTSASTGSTSPTPESSESATPTPEPDVAAALVVVTASAITVFGTDGSTLASETYRTDAAPVVERLAEALDEEATVRDTGPIGASCDSIRVYGFGGLEIYSPGGLGSGYSVSSGDLYEANVTGATTAGGVAIETVAGQHIGSTRAAFLTAVGDEIQIELYGPDAYGFDIVNPEADLYDVIGVLAWFDGDRMSSWSAPTAINFIGDCG